MSKETIFIGLLILAAFWWWTGCASVEVERPYGSSPAIDQVYDPEMGRMIEVEAFDCVPGNEDFCL